MRNLIQIVEGIEEMGGTTVSLNPSPSQIIGLCSRLSQYQILRGWFFITKTEMAGRIPRPGFYFTDDEEVVREFFGEPKKWRVRLRNAADFEHGGGSDLVKRVVAAQPSLQSALENVRTAYGSDGEDDRLATRFAARGYLQRDDFVGTLAKMGFDGMIFDDLMSQTPFTSYVAFNAGSASRA